MTTTQRPSIPETVEAVLAKHEGREPEPVYPYRYAHHVQDLHDLNCRKLGHSGPGVPAASVQVEFEDGRQLVVPHSALRRRRGM